MSNNDPNTPTASPNRRRSSFAGSKLSELFSSARNPSTSPISSTNNSPPTQTSPVFPGQIASAAAQRRMSINTLGLSGSGGSPNTNGSASATTPGVGGPAAGLWGFPRRHGSISGSSANTTGTDNESAIDESGDAGPGPMPSSPFGRRMSFGARAMGQMRNGNEGFNWADNLRSRQGRSGSLNGNGGPMSPSAVRQEAMGTGTAQREMPAPPNNPPVAPAPEQLKKRERPPPDHFQERILKGDFYMD